MQAQSEPLSRKVLENRVRESIIALDALSTDCTRYALTNQENVSDLRQWAQDVSQMAFQHARHLGIIKVSHDL